MSGAAVAANWQWQAFEPAQPIQQGLLLRRCNSAATVTPSGVT